MEWNQDNGILDRDDLEYLEYEGNYFLIDRGMLKDVRVETGFVRIPEGVVEIRRQAFLNERMGGLMEALQIPETVKKIEKLSFAGMSRLRVVEIKTGLTVLEPGIFRNCCDLETVVLPKTLVRIESRAFENCTRLDDVMLLARRVRIAEDAFLNCFRLRNKQIEEAIAEEKERRQEEEEQARLARFPHLAKQKKEEEQAARLARAKAGEKAAEENVAKMEADSEIIVGKTAENTVEEKPETAEEKAKEKTEARAGESVVKSVGEFLRATLKSAMKEMTKEAENGTKPVKELFWEDGVEVSISNNAAPVGQMVLEAASDETEYLWQQGINVNTEFCICDGVLERCEIGCAHIVVPKNVKKIAPEAFAGSEHRELLEQVDLPEGLEEIMDQAFYNLVNLEEVNFPSTLRYLGAGAFEGTAWLEAERKRSAYVVVNGILVSAYFKNMAAEAKLPETVCRIAPYAFYRCEAQLVVLSESVQEIDAYAFVESEVTEIDFSNRADVIVHTPLAARCEKLKEIYVPAKLERLETGFVENCPALRRVCLKWKETMVHKDAFSEDVRIWVL